MVPHNYSADIPQRMHSRRSHPLFGALSIEETRVEERIRTLALCIMAAAVLGATLAYLRAVLVPLVLASATRYLLAFPVDLLTRRPMGCFGVELCAQPVHEPDAPLVVRCLSELFCRLVLPRPLAVLVTLGVTGLACSYIGVLLMDSLRTFSARADTYSEQVRRLIDGVLAWLDGLELDSLPPLRLEKLHQLVGQVPLTGLVMSVVEGMLSLLSNMLLVLLFTVYLMLGRDARDGLPADDVLHKVDDRTRAFIRGKVSLSLLVGGLTALVLWSINLELWLLFAVLAFLLNFIPNIGAVVATLLPLPVAAFDPGQTSLSVFLSFALPMGVHLAVGSVLEPLIFGNSLDLHPVVVLLSLMMWGTIWGVPGLVLAVPLTAIMRIHLAHIDHPLPRYLARVLVGREVRRDPLLGSDAGSTLGDGSTTVDDGSDLASLPGSTFDSGGEEMGAHGAHGGSPPLGLDEDGEEEEADAGEEVGLLGGTGRSPPRGGARGAARDLKGLFGSRSLQRGDLV
uniref:AI-2E family transporter n=1 Tax=Emiliania huxleyi TaxID=2903 RepID=A0A7S3SPE9_EMIHU